jgi:hypothetical protein
MTLFAAVPQLIKMLKNLDSWLATATAHAEQKSFDPNILVQARLAPDQYPLARQVQSACDSAKFTGAFLSGRPAPAHPDTEQTIGELRSRIASCLAFLDTLQAADFADAATRHISPTWMAGKWLLGDDYLMQLGLPNFYFHVTTAYAILRHNGVPLGKRDFIGSLPMQG